MQFSTLNVGEETTEDRQMICASTGFAFEVIEVTCVKRKYLTRVYWIESKKSESLHGLRHLTKFLTKLMHVPSELNENSDISKNVKLSPGYGHI